MKQFLQNLEFHLPLLVSTKYGLCLCWYSMLVKERVSVNFTCVVKIGRLKILTRILR